MKKIIQPVLFLAALFVFLQQTSCLAQLLMASKTEITIDAQNEQTNIISAGDHGILLLKEAKAEKGSTSKSISLQVLDSRLNQKALLDLAVDEKMDFNHYYTDKDFLYLVYSQLNSEKITAFKVDLRNLSIKTNDFYALPQVYYYESIALDGSLFLAGVKGKKGLVVKLDFENKTGKLINLHQNNLPAFVQHLSVIDDKIYASLKSSDPKDLNLYYQAFNNSGNTIEKGEIIPEDGKKILEGHFSKNSNNKVIVAGTYSLKKSVQPLGIFYSELNSNTQFYAFSDASGNATMDIKSKGNNEALNYININKVYAVDNKLVAVAESYDIVQEKKSDLKNLIIQDPNHQFLKMWAVNNMNYNDYNIHLFTQRMNDVAAYQFKSAYTFSIDNSGLKITNLDLEDQQNDKSFNRLVSMESDGIISVINRANGEVRKFNPANMTKTSSAKKIADRDGNFVAMQTAGASFWNDQQYLHYSLEEKADEKGKYLLTLMKIRE
ncbi:hypothetical protein [Chondrinema litorale]|uniref:hypothetical protein n=1 Tax=Chondrinema litorale TaxID=2994555 RepID=UPI0025428C9E|nr:hypothetical protein [Chondrinema litorale]UZR92793.1 hypothetical protein OQ292_13110 [Chondrinema litorale]